MPARAKTSPAAVFMVSRRKNAEKRKRRLAQGDLGLVNDLFVELIKGVEAVSADAVSKSEALDPAGCRAFISGCTLTVPTSFFFLTKSKNGSLTETSRDTDRPRLCGPPSSSPLPKCRSDAARR